MFTKPTEKRDFLKLTGAVIAGSALGTATTVQAVTAKTVPAARDPLDVSAFGATGDGKSMDTLAINKAIEAAATAGGGIVRFPAGSYLCYSIHLKSHITMSGKGQLPEHGLKLRLATEPFAIGIHCNGSLLGTSRGNE